MCTCPVCVPTHAPYTVDTIPTPLPHQDTTTYSIVHGCSYNQLVEMVVSGRSESDPEKLQRGIECSFTLHIQSLTCPLSLSFPTSLTPSLPLSLPLSLPPSLPLSLPLSLLLTLPPSLPIPLYSSNSRTILGQYCQSTNLLWYIHSNELRQLIFPPK